MLFGRKSASRRACCNKHKKHFKDMMEIDDETCNEIFLLAKKVMNVLKEVYNAESVYLCTMCAGPMNHLRNRINF